MQVFSSVNISFIVPVQHGFIIHHSWNEMSSKSVRSRKDRTLAAPFCCNINKSPTSLTETDRHGGHAFFTVIDPKNMTLSVWYAQKLRLLYWNKYTDHTSSTVIGTVATSPSLSWKQRAHPFNCDWYRGQTSLPEGVVSVSKVLFGKHQDRTGVNRKCESIGQVHVLQPVIINLNHIHGLHTHI